MNWLSRIAFVLLIASAAVNVIQPRWSIVATIIGALSGTLLLVTREMGHTRNQRLRRQVLALGGSLDGIDGRVNGLDETMTGIDRRVHANRPETNTAAAFFGQGELATWNYATLLDRLKADGHIR